MLRRSRLFFSVCLLILLLVSFSFPVSAAVNSLDPYDHLVDVQYSEGYNRVYFNFDLPHLIDIWEQPGNIKTQYKNVVGNIGFRPSDTATSFRARVFLLGVEQWDSVPAVNNAVLDVSDLRSGSELTLSMQFKVTADRIFTGSSSDPSVGDDLLSGRFNFGFYSFDSNGDFISTKWGSGSSNSYEFGVSESVVYNPSFSASLPEGVTYICPFLDLEFSSTYHFNWWLFTIDPSPFSFDCDISAVSPDSATFLRIEKDLKDMGVQLDDIASGIDDVNDNLSDIDSSIQDINDTLTKPVDVDVGKADFSSAGDDLSSAMGDASSAMGDAHVHLVNMSNSGLMTSTLTSLSSGLSAAFSGRHRIRICGLDINPFNLWVVVFGGISLIVLIINYIFRKRGGGGS